MIPVTGLTFNWERDTVVQGCELVFRRYCKSIESRLTGTITGQTGTKKRAELC